MPPHPSWAWCSEFKAKEEIGMRLKEVSVLVTVQLWGQKRGPLFSPRHLTALQILSIHQAL